ncbi:hypothetical protein [Mucilaginibacter arboris]|uniref:Outer membrane protein beta-barrel domain-containing protein n=1 Tax=Mucilaginibacter arboris TaxID=2682090 RepID=A0A7K1SXZ3_9SPHI|nr:hypothetical protein [Mucilaginibacter arboris]MVN22201.1 hypothetical protein [Mucilaginibacter arboris]
MKKPILTKCYINRKLILSIAVSCSAIVLSVDVNAQVSQRYVPPQDTVKTRRDPNQSISVQKHSTQNYTPNSRIVGAAVKAAEILSDTTKYNTKMGLPIEQLFSPEDLKYIVNQGANGVVVLFDLVNKHLPKGESIAFRTEQKADVTEDDNPLELKNLRATVSANPASLLDNKDQWKENVYRAYMARDYATKLNNTITITSATREIRETPALTILDYDGGDSTVKKSITLAQILSSKQAKNKSKLLAEKEAVAEFRAHTFPGNKISQQNANENYKRALFQLIDLQAGDINRHPATRKFVDELTADLKKGDRSNVVNALKNNNFFDPNVPGNLGPVLLTESSVLSGAQVQSNPRDKALELTTLTALHYGERDAVKLLKSLVDGKGAIPAKQTNEFTPTRLNELTNHGTELLKSVGFGPSKTKNMTNSDLVLVAVAAPDAPETIRPSSFLTLQQVGNTIISNYSSTETNETRTFVLFNPRISLGSRHTEYRAAFDAVDFVPEFLNGQTVNQKGSRVVQNGAELRVESDLYFSNPQKIIETGVKPGIFPEFGVIAGIGNRSVGYDNSTTPGPFGAVPQFKNTYFTWGGHIGLNGGPILLAADATYITTQSNPDPYRTFFDLSQGMTYYRYTLLAHVINFGLGHIEQGKGTHLTIDAEYTGETNNSGTKNKTISAGGPVQTGNAEWQRDYNRAHPNGVFNYAIANTMIINGDVKATYAASSYAALNVGLQKGSVQLKATGGLYNLYTVPIDGGRLISSETFKNTFNGNLFGALSLTYHFGSASFNSVHKKTESYQTTGNGEGPHKVDEASTQQHTNFGPRNHAIFTNKKSRLKPVTVND